MFADRCFRDVPCSSQLVKVNTMRQDQFDSVIRAMCAEVDRLGNESLAWEYLPEADLIYEMALCTFSSQSVFELAGAMADRLRDDGLLCEQSFISHGDGYRAAIDKAFHRPVVFFSNGTERSAMPRFGKRLPSFLYATVSNIHGNGGSLKSLLLASTSARHARGALIATVSGFGPKQASMFLRRVGYSSDLAIVDRHIVDYLKVFRGIDVNEATLSRLTGYEAVEDELRVLALDFGYSLGCVDLATWLTMRVAKQIGLL